MIDLGCGHINTAKSSVCMHCSERIEADRDFWKDSYETLKAAHLVTDQAYQAQYERSEARCEKLAEALRMLHDETEDYIRINHLGDPHHNQSMKLSREALAAYEKEQPR